MGEVLLIHTFSYFGEGGPNFHKFTVFVCGVCVCVCVGGVWVGGWVCKCLQMITKHFLSIYLFSLQPFQKQSCGVNKKNNKNAVKLVKFLNNFILQIGNSCPFCGHQISQNWKLIGTVNVKFTILQQFNYANLGLLQN